MNAFQIGSLALIAAVVAVIAAAAARGRLGRGVAALWVALWALAAAAIVRPGLTVVAARALGIDRGADLVFYLAILFMLIGFFLVFLRLRRTEEAVTRIVRHLAIDDALSEAPPGGAASGSAPGDRDG